ncbi:DUF4240 domain-containing protein [Micromonospora narathiwatensis]|uniref:DUF4240 domain-containing protein n=1 Tax=Micromonospora narathiwatensis TaxID=299146 RepID=A0A1A9AFG7_9ACTN|nr:DUF4240 domain-containing protein [Micromonospora narathiwatensis]SBT54931.1 Protein of unknown function (DUF4240) [Micromonospora narathiwatensis]
MLEDAEFWELVGRLGGRPELQDDRPYEELTAELAQGPVERILEFAETLAYKLYQLDRRSLAETLIPGEDESGERLSDDGFLYARCAVIVAGPAAFSAVLRDGSVFRHYVTVEAAHAESILDIPSNAYEVLTGNKWDYVEEYDYETASNAEWW